MAEMELEQALKLVHNCCSHWSSGVVRKAWPVVNSHIERLSCEGKLARKHIDNLLRIIYFHEPVTDDMQDSCIRCAHDFVSEGRDHE